MYGPEEKKGKGKALIAMSGGVDSSVAAALTKEAGYDCIGVTMKLYSNQEVQVCDDHTCCSLEDVEDARSVAYSLGMPYYVFNFSEDFSEQVIDRFVKAYESGLTPNPCIDCNRYMKFERLYRRAWELGCGHVVTGHYARIEYDEASGRWLLLRAKNLEKDQSYVLSYMTQEQLAHTLFPLGEFEHKEQVREEAKARGLVNAHKGESQDICFVPDGDYAAFIERRTGKKYPEGSFVDRDGNLLGIHKGIIRYTIGQRRGLGLSLPSPLYVCGKDLERNEVILSPESELYSSVLEAKDFNWISLPPRQTGTKLRVSAKPRYRAREAAAELTVTGEGTVRLVFDEPQRAVTPGQTVTVYDRERVIGGGTIL